MKNEGYYQRVANRTRIDMDGRSPRLRLSLIGYCIEQGIVPTVEQIEALSNYVSAELDEYIATILELPVVPDDEKDSDSDVRSGYDVMSRSTYL